MFILKFPPIKHNCGNIALCHYQSYSQVWELGKTQKYHLFVPFWSTNTMNSIGGFILNLVRMHFKFDKQECSDVLNNVNFNLRYCSFLSGLVSIVDY